MFIFCYKLKGLEEHNLNFVYFIPPQQDCAELKWQNLLHLYKLYISTNYE